MSESSGMMMRLAVLLLLLTVPLLAQGNKVSNGNISLTATVEKGGKVPFVLLSFNVRGVSPDVARLTVAEWGTLRQYLYDARDRISAAEFSENYVVGTVGGVQVTAQSQVSYPFARPMDGYDRNYSATGPVKENAIELAFEFTKLSIRQSHLPRLTALIDTVDQSLSTFKPR